MNNLPIGKREAIHLNNLSNAEALMTLLIFASQNRAFMLELVYAIETMVNNEKEGNISSSHHQYELHLQAGKGKQDSSCEFWQTDYFPQERFVWLDWFHG